MTLHPLKGSERQPMPGATVVGKADPAARLQVSVFLRSRDGAGLTELMKKLANRENARRHLRRNVMFSSQNHDTDTQQIKKMMKSIVLVLAAAVGATCCLEEAKAQSASPQENQAAPPAVTQARPNADTALTVAPSLFELNGTSYKDLSYSASAKRAAYLQGMFAATHAQTSSPASCVNVDNNFRNFGTAAGYVEEGGTQGPGQEGWLMHSQSPSASSRLRYNVLFNDGTAPHTFVSATMRGAPNDGKNSYVALREQRCANDPTQTGCDEIDIVEYYGHPPHPNSQWTIYQAGNSNGNVGNGTYPTTSNPGLTAYTYQSQWPVHWCRVRRHVRPSGGRRAGARRSLREVRPAARDPQQRNHRWRG